MTLIIVHGLEGSSNSQYVIGTGSKAWVAGMNVVRMNMRNCGGTEKLGPTLYNSSMSADVAAVARTLIQDDGCRSWRSWDIPWAAIWCLSCWESGARKLRRR